MSSSTITVMRCDRCGFEAEMRSPGAEIGWGRISAARKADEDAGDRRWTIGAGARDGQFGADICPGCATELFDWWATPATVEQPAPPPVRSRPLFTIEDRSGLVPTLAAALEAQVDETGCAYRAAPTMAVHPDVPPIARAGIPDRAVDLARRIIEQLEASHR